MTVPPWNTPEMARSRHAAVESYPGPGVVVQADDSTPARVRFHVVVDITGETLFTELRVATIDALSRFSGADIAVTASELRSGQVS